jgi:hypothetical protein
MPPAGSMLLHPIIVFEMLIDEKKNALAVQ